MLITCSGFKLRTCLFVSLLKSQRYDRLLPVDAEASKLNVVDVVPESGDTVNEADGGIDEEASP